jgi:ketosteroid isomerase-like protein
MAGELEAVVLEMFDALRRKDVDALARFAADDSQGVDEISRRWLRGDDEMTRYLEGLLEMVDDVDSKLQDVHEKVYGDVGLVTFWLEQDYTLEGERQHVSAPTTVVLRRMRESWKLALFHSIPLPEAPAA